MDRRNIFAGLMVMVSSVLLLAGTASAKTGAGCEIRTLTSFVDQGEFTEHSSIADVVEVECSAQYAGTSVKISSQQLYNRCKNHLSWIQASPYRITTGPSIGKVVLDDNGKAVVVIEGGPGCAEGESIIAAHMEVTPGETVMEDFTVYAPKPTKPGVYALPSAQNEDGVNSSVAMIIQVEFPPKYAEQPVNISDEQLFTQCQLWPHLTWIGPDGGASLFKQGVESVTVKLDNDGNAFVVLLGEESCFSGESVIEASLENAPYKTYTTTFKVEPPGDTH